MTEAVYQKTKELLNNEGKVFTLFGGEHSVSIGSIRAVGEKFENLNSSSVGCSHRFTS
jgi:agmatinase